MKAPDMPTARLTDASVKRLPAPSGERVDYGDLAFPSLCLRVTGRVGQRPERRTWTYTYRHNGKQRRLTLGHFPAMTLAQAREAAGKARQQVQAGTDPAAAREEAKRQDTTVAAVAEDFVRLDLERRNRSPRYIVETRRIFKNHVLPRWGHRDIASITRRDIIALLDDIMERGTVSTGADGKRRSLRGGPILANRALSAIRAMLNWCLRRGDVETTPATLVERPGEETTRERTLTAIEIRAIWNAAERLGYPYGQFLKLAMLTGQRRKEVAEMRWDQIDLNTAIWTARTKGTKTNIVPLVPMAVEILQTLPRVAGTDFVFTMNGHGPVTGFSRAKKLIDEVTPELAPWRNHDLRRTVATEMARIGVARFIIERVLNHADRSVTAVYDRHLYVDEKRQALEKWAAHIRSLTALPAGDAADRGLRNL
jgi:integrase